VRVAEPLTGVEHRQLLALAMCLNGLQRRQVATSWPLRQDGSSRSSLWCRLGMLSPVDPADHDRHQPCKRKVMFIEASPNDPSRRGSVAPGGCRGFVTFATCSEFDFVVPLAIGVTDGRELVNPTERRLIIGSHQLCALTPNTLISRPCCWGGVICSSRLLLAQSAHPRNQRRQDPAASMLR